MDYEKYIYNLFVDNEIFDYSINEIKNQHDLNFYISLGSALNNLKHDYGLVGLKHMIDKICENIHYSINYREAKQIIKFFNYITNGMTLSYRLTIEHYKVLLKYDDISFINHCIDFYLKSPLSLDKFIEYVNNMKSN